MNYTGEKFLTVGNDQVVRLWDYQKGITVCAGYGHAAAITVGKCSPCGTFLVTCSADGAVFIWKVPKEHYPKDETDSVRSSRSSSSIASSKKSSKSSKSRNNKDENICELQTERENKDVLVCECPANILC